MNKLARGIAPLFMLLPTASWSLGLGEIEVDSALNQPLHAEIVLLSTSATELEDVKVRLASRDAFDRVGIDRGHILTQLQFKPRVENGHTVISVTSKSPIREPFLNFLVEVQWPKGKLLREYTVLLDPPVFMERRAAAATRAPVTGSASEVTRSAVRNVATPVYRAPAYGTAPAPRVRLGGSSANAAGGNPSGYTVHRGDTLLQIARDNLPAADLSPQQMMIALLRANPRAFDQANVNNLKSGFVLRIPDASEVRGIDATEARREISRHNALWREYRSRLAGMEPGRQVAASEPVTGESPKPADRESAVRETAGNADASLEILAPGDSETAAAPGEAGTANLAELEHSLALSQEVAQSRTLENESLKTRVAELEAMLEKQEQLITLQNAELADLQQRLSGGDAATGEAPDEPSTGAVEGTDVAAQAPLAEEGMTEEPVAADDLAAPEDGTGIAAEDDLFHQASVDGDSGTSAAGDQGVGEIFGQDEFADGLAGEIPGQDEFADGLAGETPGQDEFADGLAGETPGQDEFADGLAGETPGQDEFADGLAGETLGQDESAQTSAGEIAGVEETAEAPPAGAAAPAESLEEAAPPADSQEAGFVQAMLSNPTMMYAAGGAGVLLLALLGLMAARRRKQDDDGEVEPDDMSLPTGLGAEVAPDAMDNAGLAQTQALEASGQFGVAADGESAPQDEEEAGADDTDEMEKTAELGAMGAAAGSAATTADEVLSEADVYIAYRLYQQAEDLLGEALEQDPENAAYRAKLAEAYFKDGDRAGFEKSAAAMQTAGMVGDEHWGRVVVMGRQISPDHEMFRDADAQGLTEDDLVSTAPDGADFNLEATLEGEVPVESLTEDVLAGEGLADLASELDAGDGAPGAAAEAPDTDGRDPAEAPDAFASNMMEFDPDDLDLGAEASDDVLASASREDMEGKSLDFDIKDLDLGAEEGQPAAQDAVEPEDTLVPGEVEEEADAAGEGQLLDVDALVTGAMAVDDISVSLPEPEADAGAPGPALEDGTEFMEQGEVAAAGDETELIEDIQALETFGAGLDEDLLTMDAEAGGEAAGAGDRETEIMDPSLADSDIETMVSEEPVIGEEEEVDTKLDLARAYLDMGDAEGARSALEEVLEDGDNDQRAEAETLLKQIA